MNLAGNILVLDVGNTHLRAAVVDPLRHLPRTRSGTPVPLSEPARVFKCLLPEPDTTVAQELVDRIMGLGPGVASLQMALVSVVPSWSDLLAAALPQLVVLDHRIPLPFALDVEEPAAVGPDRLANMAMACAWGLSEALVVDAGTATTFDLLTSGRFAGGLIAPGVELAARSLAEHAARLEPVKLQPGPCRAGRSTAAAMATGSWAVGRYGILGTIAALLEVHGPRPVIMTGGLGSLLAVPEAFADPAWTLRGAAHLARISGS